MRPVLIVGLQKSGTSLLLRLLCECGVARNPFRGEADELWGNEPPFAPTGRPAGEVYQRSGGERGHVAEAADADAAAARVVRARLAPVSDGGLPIVNKNPYNTVRIAWLRALVPEAVIVAVVRPALPTVFSLLKKHTPHEGRGRAPEDGWWGVKPAGWRALRDADLAVQCARQWAAVNRHVLEAEALVDVLLSYRDVCADPAAAVDLVAERAGGPPRASAPPPLRCFDDEYRHGARLRSKNRYFAERGSLSVPSGEAVEQPPLTPDQRTVIERHTRSVSQRLFDHRGDVLRAGS